MVRSYQFINQIKWNSFYSSICQLNDIATQHRHYWGNLCSLLLCCSQLSCLLTKSIKQLCMLWEGIKSQQTQMNTSQPITFYFNFPKMPTGSLWEIIKRSITTVRHTSFLLSGQYPAHPCISWNFQLVSVIKNFFCISAILNSKIPFHTLFTRNAYGLT